MCVCADIALAAFMPSEGQVKQTTNFNVPSTIQSKFNDGIYYFYEATYFLSSVVATFVQVRFSLTNTTHKHTQANTHTYTHECTHTNKRII